MKVKVVDTLGAGVLPISGLDCKAVPCSVGDVLEVRPWYGRELVAAGVAEVVATGSLALPAEDARRPDSSSYTVAEIGDLLRRKPSEELVRGLWLSEQLRPEPRVTALRLLSGYLKE